jgi:hypothetical protein
MIKWFQKTKRWFFLPMTKKFFRKWFRSLFIFFTGALFVSAVAMYNMIVNGHLLEKNAFDNFITLLCNVASWSILISLSGVIISSICYYHDIKEQSSHSESVV